jgi:putative membrane protein
MGNGDIRRSAIAAMAAANLMFASGPVLARSPDSTEANRAFVKEVIQGDLAEIQIGKLAQEKGASEKAKQFGQRLENDHSANLKKVRALAESLGVPPPTAPDAKQESTYDRLSSLSGQSFDRRFAKKMVQDHRKDIKAFQQKSTGSGPVADFAKQTLPTLQEHLKLAKALSGART